jgi:dTDP-glucose 4,6-dehydratase
VEDHCRALEIVILKGQVGQIYNIAGGQEKPNLDIVKLLLNIMDKPESLITFVKDRPAHDRRYAIDCRKITKELGWKPSYSLGKAMKSTVNWYMQNESWWQRIKSGEYAKYYERLYHQP